MVKGDGSGGDSIFGVRGGGVAGGGSSSAGKPDTLTTRDGPPAVHMCLPPRTPTRPQGKFKDEPAALKLKHDAAGVVSMANSGKHSNTSQWFFTLAPAPQCDGKHVVVGRVVEGAEVLRLIGKWRGG